MRMNEGYQRTEMKHEKTIRKAGQMNVLGKYDSDYTSQVRSATLNSRACELRHGKCTLYSVHLKTQDTKNRARVRALIDPVLLREA